MKNEKKGDAEWLLGVDPSSQRNNGMGMYNPKKREFHSIFTKSLVSCFGQVQEYGEMFGKENIAIVIEFAELNSQVFGAVEALKKAKKLPMALYTKEVGKWLKVAENLGKQKQVGKEMKETFSRWGYTVHLLAPSWRDATHDRKGKAKGKKIGGLSTKKIEAYQMPTKTTKKQFDQWCKLKRIKLVDYVISEHARDACTSVGGHTETTIKQFLAMQQMKRGTGKRTTTWKQFANKNKNKIR